MCCALYDIDHGLSYKRSRPLKASVGFEYSLCPPPRACRHRDIDPKDDDEHMLGGMTGMTQLEEEQASGGSSYVAFPATSSLVLHIATTLVHSLVLLPPHEHTSAIATTS